MQQTLKVATAKVQALLPSLLSCIPGVGPWRGAPLMAPLPCLVQQPPTPLCLSQDHGGPLSFSSWTSAPNNSGIYCVSLPSTRLPTCGAQVNWMAILPCLLNPMHQASISVCPLVCQLQVNSESTLKTNAAVRMGGSYKRSFTF